MNDIEELEDEDFGDSDEVNTTPESYHVQAADAVNITNLGDEYDYDVEASINSFFWDELLPTLIVYSLTFILGLVGNILIIFTTFRYRKMKSTTNVFLASLASADLLLIVFCIPVKEVFLDDNSVTKENNTPKDVSKELALNKLREILDELVTDDELIKKEEENPVGGENQKNESDNRMVLMNVLGKGETEASELEQLILKLKSALKDCNDALEPCCIESEKEKETEKFPNETVPCIIAYPVSTVKSGQSGHASSRREADVGMGQMKKLKNYNFDEEDDEDEVEDEDVTVLKHKMMADLSPREGAILEGLSRRKQRRPVSQRSDLMSSPSESSVPGTVRETKSVKSGKSTKSSKSEKSNASKISEPSNKSSAKSPRRSTIDALYENRASPNWESTKIVEKRIVKLECRLKELLRRIGVCPTKEQDAIKRCLERLKDTSEAVLKRLKVNRSDGCKCPPGCQGDRAEDIAQRGYQSEPDSTIKMNRDRKPIILKTSGSEIQLNVGMEITMENFDPVTGEKLRPEENRDFEQQGNIQCKLVKPGEKPVTFINTDFLYNPKTGMLFKGGEQSSRGMRNEDLPLKPTKTYLLSETIKPPFPPNPESDSSTKKPRFAELYEREHPPEGFRYSKFRDRETSPDTSKSLHSDAFRLAVEREELKNVRYLEEVRKDLRKESKSPTRRDNQKKVSLIPTARSATKSGRGNCDQGNARIVEKRAPEQTFHLKEALQLAKLFSYTWMFGFFICKLVYYMQSVSAICSVLTLTAMSVERYYAIVHPMRAQYVCTISQARKIITFTWISSLFLAIPVLFAQIHMPVGVRIKGFWCVRDYDNPAIWRAHETYMLLLILVIPTSVMGVAYTTICLEIWQVMQRRQDLTSAKILNIRYNKSSENSDNFCMYGKEKKPQRKTFGESADDTAHVKQVIKMLVAVVVIYVVCWSPLLIDNLLQAYGVLPFMKFGKQKYMATAFHLMAYFNSCINPIIYGFMSKNFRESFRKALCCSPRKGNASMRNPSMSNDRSTSIRYAESSFGRTVSITLPD